MSVCLSVCLSVYPTSYYFSTNHRIATNEVSLDAELSGEGLDLNYNEIGQKLRTGWPENYFFRTFLAIFRHFFEVLEKIERVNFMQITLNFNTS